MKTKTKNPGKQRKRLFTADHRLLGKNIVSHLSDDLAEEHRSRSMPLRSGDTVKIYRGDYKGFEGKVTRIDRGNLRIYVDGISREKADGSTVSVPIDASKVEITKLDTSDKWRKKILERKKASSVFPITNEKSTEAQKLVDLKEK